MSEVRLTTPEGYFETSMEKTMASARKIRRRRKAVLYSCAALVLTIGAYLSIQTATVREVEREYLTQQAEIARLDVFFEVNN